MATVFNQSIWGDEGFSAILSMKSLPEIIRIIANDTSPPLWNITEWIVFNTLGTDEIYIRGLAFLYFILAVFFVFKIGNFLFNKRTGLLAALLTFFNPFFFIYAFEGRMYSILALGVTASMYFFLRLVYGRKPTKTDKVGYIVSALWAMYSHHFAIFALFIQAGWFAKMFLFGDRKRSKTIFKTFIAIGLLYLPWVIPLYNQTTKVGGGFWLGTPNFEDLIRLVADYLAQGIKLMSNELPLISIKIYELAFYIMLLILLVRKWSQKKEKTLFLIIWFLGPIVMTWLVSQVFQSIFFNRYLLYAIPGGMLIPASNRKKLSNILIAFVLVLFVIIDWHYFTNPSKLRFREMAVWVKSTRQEGDFLINWNSSAHHLWETKYYDIPAPIYIPGGGELPFFVGTALMEEDDIVHTLPEDTNRIGVVTSGPIEEIDLPLYTEVDRKVLGDLKFLWLAKSLQQPQQP